MNAVSRAQAGDNDAIRVLYLRYKDNVYGYVLSFVRDQHEAEDITQHVFLKLMSVIHKYRAREVPFTSWLLRVARNVALDHMRRRRTLPCEEVYETGHESDQMSDDLRRGLEQALQALPEDQRNVIVLRHLVGLTPGEIASADGSHRVVDPRTAPSRPSGTQAGTAGDRVRAHGARRLSARPRPAAPD